MTKFTLNKDQVFEFVSTNNYEVDPSQKSLSRCIDGRYTGTRDLPPLAIPGADAGQLALIVAASNHYGFEIDLQKVFNVIVTYIGGIQNFHFHADYRPEEAVPEGTCGHLQQLMRDPEAYYLEKDQITQLQEVFYKAEQAGAQILTLVGNHNEAAVLQVKGQYSLYPRLMMEGDKGSRATQAFIFHQSLANERHRGLIEKLLEEKAVTPFPGTNGEYLYQVISEMLDNHFLETTKRLASGLPIYEVNFAKDGTFEVEDVGTV